MKFPGALLLLGLLLGSGARLQADETWVSGRTGAEHLEVSALVPKSVQYSRIRWQSGDDARWAEPGWDDSAWTEMSARRVPSHTGVFWARFKVRDTAGPLPPGMFIQATMAYDLYWDGKLIGRAGVPGASFEREVPGNLDNVFTLPDEARGPGEHQVAMRISNYRNRFPDETMPFIMLALSPAEFLARADRENLRSAVVVGAGTMLAFAGLIAWLLVDRRPVLLLFTGLCLGASLMQGLFIARFVFGYTYDWHFTVWALQVLASNIFAVCLASIVIVHFRLPWWTWIPVALTPLLGQLAWVWQASTRLVLPLLLLQALLGSLWAACRGRRGAALVATGIGITVLLWVLNPIHFLSPAFIRYFLPMLVGLTVAVAITVRDERQRAQRVQLTAARLEIELLKKNLQPHFLLNTLTAVSEVIEQDPRGAVQFIDDLAGEFRSLTQMSGEKLVPLAQELELCRAHLRVVARRTGRPLALESDGPDAGALVPPALFLTLIENGLIYQQSAPGAAFRLCVMRDPSGCLYTFLSPGKLREKPDRVHTGTGLRYVKARLEESFPGRWTFRQRGTAEGWETTIELKAGGSA